MTVTLHTARTPNGQKISIALEELGLAYTVRCVDLKALEQKQPAFLAINPNGRIPAIVDHDPADRAAIDPALGGLAVFESGAILIYLAEKTGRLLPQDLAGRSRTLQWLMFQMGGVGPMQGQANVFFRYFPEKIPAAIERYQNETRRLYGVMDAQLAQREFIAGAQYTIADIAIYPWVSQAEWSGIDIAPFEHLARWVERIGARAAVQRGMQVPEGQRVPQQVIEAAQAMLAR